MYKENFNGWYLINPEAISRYLFSVMKNWGYFVYYNQSDDSESYYLNVNLGTKEDPNALHLRISNHSVPLKNQWIMFNFDIYCGHDRKGATSYINVLNILAEDLNRPMPAYLDKVKVGTLPYKQYRIEMQNRAKEKSSYSTGDRLYV